MSRAGLESASPHRQTLQAAGTFALDIQGEQGEIMVHEVERRANLALVAIKQAFGTEADEFGATMFVNHHLEEIPRDYWQEHLGTAMPEPSAVLGLLELKSNWGEGDIENFDFSLPGEVTQYVISVNFDSAGEIAEISMES